MMFKRILLILARSYHQTKELKGRLGWIIFTLLFYAWLILSVVPEIIQPEPAEGMWYIQAFTLFTVFGLICPLIRRLDGTYFPNTPRW